MKKATVILGIILAVSLLLSIACGKDEEQPASESVVSNAEEVVKELTPIEELGKRLFFDARLSSPERQSCAVCHAPIVGWTGPDSAINEIGSVYEGAVKGRFGNRKPPSAAYASESSVLHIDEERNFVGGMFWDGRASGEKLGDPLAEQAMGPFLNPLEQNNPDKKSIIIKVRESSYAQLFEEVWGPGSLDEEIDVDETYERIGRSIAAYERSSEVNPFSSKFDDFWRKSTSLGLEVSQIDESNWEEYRNLGLDDEELQGLMFFNTKGLCAECHILTSVNGKPPLFTDFTYDNLGVPKNPELPFYKMAEEWNPDGENWVDKGLGGYLETTEKYAKYASENFGKHKVPTLRNVGLKPRAEFVKAYMHNGFFKTLKDVVRFYNTRDVADSDWPPPEIDKNVNTEELGALGLSKDEEDAIVKFMETLSDKN